MMNGNFYISSVPKRIMSSVVETLLEKLNSRNKLSQVLDSRGTDLEGDKVMALDLSGLDLQDLPAGVFNDLKDLKKLNLAHNNLTSLNPDTFSSLSNLTFLSFFSNQLENVPEKLLSSLPNLGWLDLRENELSEIPKSVLDLKKLNYLFLQNNSGLRTDEFDFSEDYHSKRDIGKFFEAFQKASGIEPAEKPAKTE